MFLKKLIISTPEAIIREINFHKGINLIVDETSGENIKESGNNVGKTTVLRLINYCLGGRDESNIYKDPEFRDRPNKEVKNFLKNSNIEITLVLSESLEDMFAEEIIIKRNFQLRKSKLLSINGKNYNLPDFNNKLNELIFNSTLSKPSFRSIISKNIRDDRNRLIRTIKILEQGSNADYETLYFYWLGIPINGERKLDLKKEIKLEETYIKHTNIDMDSSQIHQALLVIERNINELERQKNLFALNENYEKDINALDEVKNKINSLSAQNGQLQLRRSLIQESIEELNREKSNVDLERVQFLYREAKVLIPDLQKSYEDTYEFHNKMVEEKRKFISKELPKLETEIQNNEVQISQLLEQEKHLSQKLVKEGAIQSIETIIKNLNYEYERKGKYTEQKNILEKSQAKLASLNEELNAINEKLNDRADELEEKITVFNKYFSEISAKLYQERFILSKKKEDTEYELHIGTIDGNPGTGKKKGEIMSFDLAYIQFADALGIKCLHFILHDQIETVHENQINNILTNIVKNINCQLILPVLKDKLPQNIDISKYTILSLSQESKLFKI